MLIHDHFVGIKRILLMCSLVLLIATVRGFGNDNTPAVPPSKQIIGWLELIHIYPGRLAIRAKMDTGAKTASLNATRLVEFEKNGEKWVRFTVTDKKGPPVTFEEKILRYVKIKENNGALQKRPVIRLWLCIGDQTHAAEVNLTDRSFLNYQLLIGRTFLKEKYVIDAERTFTVKPVCRPSGGRIK